MKTPLKNLRIYGTLVLAKAYPVSINTMQGPIQSRETVPLNYEGVFNSAWGGVEELTK